MNIQKFIGSIIVSCCGVFFTAQGQPPVIKASSRSVDIRDGLHYRKGYWYLFPEKKPDVYYVEIPRKEHTVTFLTDTDSISFQVNYAGEYDFIILLNNKDSCHTRIIARYKATVPYRSDRQHPARDTIPFRVGNNSKIYLTGQLNGAGPFNIQFDLGNSGAPVIKKSSVKKTHIHFDDSITLSNSDGTNVVPFSNVNRLEIAGLTWDSVPVAAGDNMTRREDLVVGNYLFQDKIIEINYDKSILIIHDTLPPIDAGYSRHDMTLDGGIVPLLRAVLFYGSKNKEGWFMFDTGAYTTILNNQTIPASNKMIAEAKKMLGLNNKAMQPELTIGNYRFAGFNYTTQQLNEKDCMGLLGNDLLKRFNIILDNKNGQIYLKPNSLASVPYANPEFYAVRVITGLFLMGALVVIVMMYRKKWKKRRASM